MQCRGQIFLNADLLQWRLAEHASSTFRWFLNFVSKNNDFFQVLWSSTVLAGLFVSQIHGNQVLQLEREFLNVSFRVSYRNQQKPDYLCQS